MSSVTRLRWVHLTTQILAVVAVIAVLASGREAVAAWSVPSEKYSAEFNGHFADLGRTPVQGIEVLRARVSFLEENLPHQLRIEGAFLRLVLLVALILILPVGVGAAMHRAASREAAARGDTRSEEGLALLARLQFLLSILAGLGILTALASASARSPEAESRLATAVSALADPGDREAGLLTGLVRDAFKAARDSSRAAKGWMAAALGLVTLAFMMGIAMHIFAAKYLASTERLGHVDGSNKSEP